MLLSTGQTTTAVYYRNNCGLELYLVTLKLSRYQAQTAINNFFSSHYITQS